MWTGERHYQRTNAGRWQHFSSRFNRRVTADTWRLPVYIPFELVALPPDANGIPLEASKSAVIYSTAGLFWKCNIRPLWTSSFVNDLQLLELLVSQSETLNESTYELESLLRLRNQGAVHVL